MKSCTQLNQGKRYQISGLRKAAWNQTPIASAMGVHKSTISRELNVTQAYGASGPRRRNDFVTRVGKAVSMASGFARPFCRWEGVQGHFADNKQAAKIAAIPPSAHV